MPSKPLLTPKDACRLLRVSRSWLYAAAADGRVPHLRLGGEKGPVRFVEEDLHGWLAEQYAREAKKRAEPD